MSGFADGAAALPATGTAGLAPSRGAQCRSSRTGGDQAAHRKARGFHGGSPIGPYAANHRNGSKHFVNRLGQWRGPITRYDQHAPTYRGVLAREPGGTLTLRPS